MGAGHQPATVTGLMPAAVLTNERVSAFARLALNGIVREFPNQPMNLHAGNGSALGPRELHPVFYGCFDWHSAVHSHWMLVRLLRLYPEATIASEISAVLDKQFSQDGLAIEASYFEAQNNRSFERMYGWAWALRLAGELGSWDDPDARRWALNYEPLQAILVQMAKAYLPKLDWPIRCGFHPESAFSLSQFFDFAEAIGDSDLVSLVRGRTLAFYRTDRDYPVSYEPSGNDFFSAGLNEADLMRRVLSINDFRSWLDAFFPGLAIGQMGNLLEPVVVGDMADGHLAHLAGLNLSRAWAMRGIRSALSDDDPRAFVLGEAANAHAAAGLGSVFSGHYAGEHWLATFAVYLLTESIPLRTVSAKA